MLANESNSKGDTKRKQALDTWNYILNTWYWKTEPEVMRILPLMPWRSQKISRLQTAREKKHCTTKAGWSAAFEWILLVLFSQTGMMRLCGAQWGRHDGYTRLLLDAWRRERISGRFSSLYEMVARFGTEGADKHLWRCIWLRVIPTCVLG